MKGPNFDYFSNFYTSIPYPIQVIDEAGVIFYTNPAFTYLWGFQPEELQEYNFFEDTEVRKKGFHIKVKEVGDSVSEVILNGFTDSLLKNKDRTLPSLKTVVFPVILSKKKFYVLVHQDETDAIVSEAEIRKSREGNKEAQRLKDTFLNVLSHELRTPLNIVLGYSSIIRESLKDKINIEDRIYLDNLYSGSERLFKSITQMLEFAQIEAGIYNINFETADLVIILKNSIGLIRHEAEEKKLGIKASFKRNSILVNIDIQSTENAINNLLNNAVKFTKQGFIEIELDVLEDREVAICKIKDSGIGISTEYLDHLFRPFSQEDLNVGRNFEGNGLGLALAKRYIEKMGGSLLVDSIKGVGSTFTFTLPLISQSDRKEKPSAVNEGRILKKVFMIDSERESLELLNAFLKNKYIIDSSNYASFDVSMLKKDEYQLIICDVDQNHWEEGLNVCVNIRASVNLPIVILSSEFMDERIRQYYNAGADKFLIKPFSKLELLRALDVLEKSET